MNGVPECAILESEMANPTACDASRGRFGHSRRRIAPTVLLVAIAIVAFVFGSGWIPPACASTIAEAKMQPDWSPVDIGGALVSVAWESSLYVESDDRSCGIRVDFMGPSPALPARANITGTMRTDVNTGERYIAAETMTTAATSDTVLPLGIIPENLGGSDWMYVFGSGAGQMGVAGGLGLNNVGLLVKTWGWLIPFSESWCILRDSHGRGLTVYAPPGQSIPAFLPPKPFLGSVTGISSLERDSVTGTVRPALKLASTGAIQSTPQYTATIEGAASIIDGQLDYSGSAKNFVSSTMRTWFTPTSNIGCVYVRFDLAAIQSASYADVAGATLTLYVTAVTNPQSLPLRVSRIDPNNTYTSPLGFTWLYNDSGSSRLWTGGNFQSSAAGNTATTTVSAVGTVTVDVSNIVRQWLYGGKANVGLVIQLGGPYQLSSSYSANSVTFGSRENTDPSRRPKLRVELTSVATPYVPVRKPYRMWYQPAFVESNPGYYRNANYVASSSNLDGGVEYARFWNSLGVAVGHWAFGPSNPWPTGDPEFYKQQANPNIGDWTSTGPGFDEWIGGYESEKEACAAGWRLARAQWPDVFMSCYFTSPDDLFKSLVADGTIDLAVIEGYFEISLEGALSRCEVMKSAGLIEKTINLFGQIIPAQTSKSRLNLWVSTVHDSYPEMPGIGMYGLASDSSPEARELIQYADWLTGFYCGDDVLFIDGFESGSFAHGQWSAGGSPIIREGFTWVLNEAGFPWSGGEFQFCGTGSTSSAVATSPGLVEIDVTSMVNAWLYQAKLNNGFMIQLGGPIYGIPGGTARGIAFDSSETSQASLAPKLMVKIAPGGQYQTVQGPAYTVDGNLSMRSVYSRDFSGPALSTFFSPWWDYGAIYLRFDLSGINKSGYSSVSNAKLVLNATSVTNPDSVGLRVQRVSESNTNTEPEVTGADSRRCVQLVGTQSIQRAVSTAGRSGIRLEYMVRADGFTSGNHCYVEWHDGSAWHTADDITQSSAFTSRSVALPAQAANNPNFKIRFRAALSGGMAMIDRVRVTGTRI